MSNTYIDYINFYIVLFSAKFIDDVVESKKLNYIYWKNFLNQFSWDPKPGKNIATLLHLFVIGDILKIPFGIAGC